MINHARTLLLNVAGSSSQSSDNGEEYIPPSFAPLRLPTYLQTPHNVLFGTAPDRYFLNFRARELLQLLHLTELAEFVYALDPRVTYWPETTAKFFGPAAKISIDASSLNSHSQLFISGDDAADLGGGKSQREYVIVVSGSNAETRLVTTGDTSSTPLVLTDAASQPIPLPKSPLSFRLVNAADGDTWTVITVARPAPAITTLLPILELLGEPVFLELFGVNPAEPYATFKNLWFDHPNAAYRLGGLLLAMIYRTNEVRNQTNA
jgi:hypothetical protein